MGENSYVKGKFRSITTKKMINRTQAPQTVFSLKIIKLTARENLCTLEDVLSA